MAAIVPSASPARRERISEKEYGATDDGLELTVAPPIDVAAGTREEARQFWAAILQGARPSRAVDSGRALPTGTSLATESKRQEISVALDDYWMLEQLSAVLRESKISRQTFFEALWAIVVHHHAGTNEVLFGSLNSSPNAPQSPGPNFYPLRITIPEEDNFGELAQSIEAYHLAAAAKACLTYEEIENCSEGAALESAVIYEPVQSPTLFAKLPSFPVIIAVTGDRSSRLTLSYTSFLEYREARLLLSHFVEAIKDALCKLYLPHAPVESIHLASAEEQISVVHANRSNKPEHATTIVRMFEDAVVSHEDERAIEDSEHHSMSYKEVNAAANKLARILSLKQGDIVPICMNRSLEMVIAMIAVLKSGAAYTVLDPDSPSGRNAQMVKDAGAEVVLAHEEYMGGFEVCLNMTDACARFRQLNIDNTNLSINIEPEHRCYVIYTSGSTGKPKGVVLSHRAATNGMRYHSLQGRKRWLLFYNPTFSAAQRTMLSTLVHGGTLVIPGKAEIQNAPAELINDLKVDSLGITPSALSTISPEAVPSLKQVTLVGERLTKDQVAKWVDHVEVRNTYGLSEVAQLNFGTRLGPNSNPSNVDHPKDTTSAYVLVPGSVELSPIGVPGELCLVGPQLADGYLNDPERTKRAFLDNPLGPGRMYRTGDMAKMHHDGSFGILGRLDFQAKINGQKVEPGEVDKALSSHPAISGTVTVPAEISGRTSLVTGVVLNEGINWIDVMPNVRAHADRSLPAFMRPAYWVRLTEVPKNVNGKTDLRGFHDHVVAMSVEELIQAGVDQVETTSVSDPTEKRIAESWAGALGLDVSLIKREHSFLALGDTSIQAIKALSELRKAGFEATLSSLLGDDTVQTAAQSYKKLTPAERDEDPEPFALVKDNELIQRLKEEGASDAYPTTALQQDMLAALMIGDTMYTYQRVWDVSELDLVRLKQSFHAIVQRSAILRTRFIPFQQGMLQVVQQDIDVPWNERNDHLEEFLQRDKAEPLTLDGPLFRLTLLSNRYLVVTMHHSLFDFWSYRFLYQDVASIYLGRELTDRAPYARFVNTISKSSKQSSQRFWQRYLKGAEPTILNYSPVQKTSKLTKTIASGSRADLKGLGLTSGFAYYAAWAILLQKHLGNNDVTFMTSLSGRDTAVSEIGTIDGPTLAMVPQRIVLDPAQSLKDIAKTVGQGVMDLAPHAASGLRKAFAAAHLDASSFDTFLNVLVSPERDADADRVFKRHGPASHWTTKWITTEVEETPEGTTFRISGGMEERRLRYILDSYVSIVDSIERDPSTTLSELRIIGPDEAQYLTNTISNKSALRVPAPRLLHASFEEHANKRPESIAIAWNGELELTYQTLNRRANHFAEQLRSVDVKAGDFVALLLDKSVETIVSILGTLKAGAAYVPMSPDNPMERNSFILHDVQAKVLVAHRQYAAVGKQGGVQTLIVEDLGLDQETPLVSSFAVSPSHVAYAIYTSGSSGTPKGVMVPHRAAAAAVESMAVVEGRHHGEWRALQFANYVFDASVQDIFNTLSTGGALCMAPSESMLSDLPVVVKATGAKQAILTPTVAGLLQPAEVPGLETMIVGGEPLTRDVVETWAPNTRLLNVYGPTETSMVVTTKHVQNTDCLVSNIGSPFPTVAAFVLSPEGVELVPYGAVGELCIGGPQLSDGYFNREDLTTSAFVDGSALGVAKLYRTGDLVRWLPNGELACLGRKDGQVKIHGHRIELGEIEVTLTRTGLMKDCAVLLAHIGGKPALAAFCVFEQSTSTSIAPAEEYVDDIRMLQEALPQSGLAPYMIPGYILPIGSLPKLPSRKVDRKTLTRMVEEMEVSSVRQYSLTSSASSGATVPVETTEEAVLERLWSTILQIPTEDIGRDGNFLALGGDSISAIALTSSARAEGYVLSVNSILKTPALQDMAKAMKARIEVEIGPKREWSVPADVKSRSEEVGLDWQRDVEYVYPCPPGQAEFAAQGEREEQMWVLMASRRMPAAIGIDHWVASTTKLIDTNDILRTSWLKTQDGQWVGVVLRSPNPDLTTVPCSTEIEANAVVEPFWADRFTFGQPFIKFLVIKYPDGTWDLIVKLNHAMYDGTLLRIFDDHFGAIVRDEPLPAHEKFKDFAFHMYESEKTESLAYWKNAMSGKQPGYLANVPSPKITKTYRTAIPTGVDELAQACGVTPSIVFQAAYQLWLARQVTGGHTDRGHELDINFDYLLSGRNMPSFPGNPLLVNGTLANFLPFRLRLDPSATTLKDYLQRTQDTFWSVTENGNLGLDMIYSSALLERKDVGNKTLFLFQPFEPAGGRDEERWLILAKSQNRMYQPYGLVVEVAKSPEEGKHKLAVMYDESLFEAEHVKGIASEILRIVDDFVAKTGGVDCPLTGFLSPR
ncbi:Acetyl CoA synthetase-like protein [Teratosphaeria destructans]|uniref:Acetyl CoA synthetase-like protein n=1 Tax=Teratosphaeria destructans TaxID=418781 RepID=A0A9W7W4B6_9PEZI|nr:Acetyl CoA synthetase-like protein [Teratosphaeria destructans]